MASKLVAMIRAFVDANVLFAAAYSSTGAARDLINLSLEQKVILILSPHVTDEVRHNLTNKYPERLSTFEQILKTAVLKKLTNQLVKKCWKQRVIPHSRMHRL